VEAVVVAGEEVNGGGKGVAWVGSMEKLGDGIADEAEKRGEGSD